MSKLRWPIVLGVVVIAFGLLAFVWAQQNKGSKEKLSPLPERTKLEQEADTIRVEVAGQELDVESLKHTEGGWAVFVSGDAKGTDLDGILKQAADLFAGLDRLGLTFADLGMLLKTSDLKDVYGRTLEELPIVEIGLSKQTFETIDWNGFEPTNFERVADRYWVHEEIQKMAEEKKAKEQASGGGSGDSGGGSSGGGGS